MKCPKCGYENPYWLKMGFDREAEYCKFEDVEERFKDMKVKEQRVENEFIYRRTSEKWIIRIPLNIWFSRGCTFSKPKGYWDGSSTKGI